MPSVEERTRTFKIGDQETVQPGGTKHISFKISETTTGRPIYTPIFVANSKEPGPALFLVAGIHGNELNGIEIVRECIQKIDFSQMKGAVICIPVINVPGFLTGRRTLPNDEDLNRVFPGIKDGSPGERIADLVMQILSQCDHGISFHTAVNNWNNIPHIKANVQNPAIKRLAKAFGTEIIINEPGVEGMLRRAMNDMGIPCTILEAGEPNKFQRDIIDMGVTGARNVMAELGILPGEMRGPAFRVFVKKTVFIRADHGGIIHMRVRPRQLIYKDEPLFTVTNPFGKERATLNAPFTGMVVGVRTKPVVSPGTSVVHLVKLDKTLARVEEKLRESMERKVEAAMTPTLAVPEEKVVEVEVKGENGDDAPHKEHEGEF
jgi:predicted deacylase